jgi:hypothetical protein
MEFHVQPGHACLVLCRKDGTHARVMFLEEAFDRPFAFVLQDTAEPAFRELVRQDRAAHEEQTG